MTSLATCDLVFPAWDVTQFRVRRMRKILELILMTIFAGFTANMVPGPVGDSLSLNRLGGLGRGSRGQPGETGEEQAADQQRANGFVRRHLCVLCHS